jgi:hypothetical protein
LIEFSFAAAVFAPQQQRTIEWLDDIRTPSGARIARFTIELEIGVFGFAFSMKTGGRLVLLDFELDRATMSSFAPQIDQQH